MAFSLKPKATAHTGLPSAQRAGDIMSHVVVDGSHGLEQQLAVLDLNSADGQGVGTGRRYIPPHLRNKDASKNAGNAYSSGRQSGFSVAPVLSSSPAHTDSSVATDGNEDTASVNSWADRCGKFEHQTLAWHGLPCFCQF
ncbi:hypothetical protein DNTS_013717 [Danionella cerebrum]|uniref:Uncharacterized protein n=1 Tax=Danionella cerebrum TaxID=2873325 RepID=A0A553R4W9_9TELE|nr:hypothetical protein DNTS_013717 [Danionella translucida]